MDISEWNRIHSEESNSQCEDESKFLNIVFISILRVEMTCPRMGMYSSKNGMTFRYVIVFRPDISHPQAQYCHFGDGMNAILPFPFPFWEWCRLLIGMNIDYIYSFPFTEWKGLSRKWKSFIPEETFSENECLRMSSSRFSEWGWKYRNDCKFILKWKWNDISWPAPGNEYIRMSLFPLPKQKCKPNDSFLGTKTGSVLGPWIHHL